jgi:hypothetical protein
MKNYKIFGTFYINPYGAKQRRVAWLRHVAVLEI